MKANMNKRLFPSTRRVCYFLLSSLAAGLVLSGCASEETAPEPKLRPIKSIIVDSGSGESRQRVFSGTAQAAQEVDLSFKVSGSIASLNVKVGDQLESGSLVAQLDDELYRVELNQARAQLARSEAAKRSAEADYQRVRELFTNDNASRNELDNALAETESAAASFRADNEQLKLAQLNLSYTRLSLTGACSIAQVSAEANENIVSGQTIARANCGDGWEVSIAVPETLISRFEAGLSGIINFTSIPEQSFA
ncbi:MAG: efflux RND transporter periplasmic adaptor subunit, partial [Pseudomonadota bacterium]